MVSEAWFPIDMASKRSGLSVHVIRIWEKRYGAVTPRRTATNRRLYSDGDVRRLCLLRRAVESGYRIGVIAKIPDRKLLSLLADQPSSETRHSRVRGVDSMDPARLFQDTAVAAVKELDSERLRDVLERALLALGAQGLLARVIAPLAHTVGELWQDGGLTAAHEHFLSGAIKVFLGQVTGQFVLPDNAPVLIVATPAGQIHELGAVLAGTAAANAGWRVTYLGPSLPAAEIAGAAAQQQARAIALSIVYPPDDPALARELVDLRRFAPESTEIIIGGRAAPSYEKNLKNLGAHRSADLDQLITILAKLRTGPRRKSGAGSSP